MELVEKEEMGFLTRTWQLIKENLTYILTVAMTILAILGAIITNKKNKLETRLKEMELQRELNKKDDHGGDIIITS